MTYHTESYRGSLNRVEYWKYHVDGWSDFKNKIFFVRFEDIISNYDNTLLLMSKFLNTTPKENIVDVRLNASTMVVKKNTKPVAGNEIFYTTENFQSGEIGSYAKYLNDESISRIDKLTNTFYHNLINLS